MHSTAIDSSCENPIRDEEVLHWVEHAVHHLPSQGPIKVFVHHNTLHALEHLPFEEGIVEGYKIFGGEPYLSERQYRREVSSGRIRHVDIETVLRESLTGEADKRVAGLDSRLDIRSSILRFPWYSLPYRELQWLLADTDAFRRFRSDIEDSRRYGMIAKVRAGVEGWIRSEKSFPPAVSDPAGLDEPVHSLSPQSLEVLRTFYQSNIKQGSSDLAGIDWESFTLRLLWSVCKFGAEAARSRALPMRPDFLRLRDRMLDETGVDADSMVHELLIRFTASFLDQGFSAWEMPKREEGFLASFYATYQQSALIQARWLAGLSKALQTYMKEDDCPDRIACRMIRSELDRMNVPQERRSDFLTASLLALPGWSGMIHQMETSAPWTPRPAPPGSLLQFAAVRLLLDRLAYEYFIDRANHKNTQNKGYAELRDDAPENVQIEGTAYAIFQIAQIRSWSPAELLRLSGDQWTELVDELASFNEMARRRIYHFAYERKFRIEALDAISSHTKKRRERRERTNKSSPLFQVVTCIDDREESFRRHLEEVEPSCETFGAPGFFAVVMYYRGAAEAHYRPLCPINVIPKHYVIEEPVFSASHVSTIRSRRRRMVGKLIRQVHAGSRTATWGILTGLFGSLATFPLVARVLAPRTASRVRESFGGLIRPPATDLHLERLQGEPGQAYESHGYDEKEMANIVVRILQDIGLVKEFAPIVLFLGHGSSSLNNPHESAYNCGACSGGRGGPNARAFAAMANDPRVRKLTAMSGIEIPDSVRFVGGYHNTCDDGIVYFDLDELPRTHHHAFRELESRLDEVRRRNAHERCRRFESAPLKLSLQAALQHVEERSEDLSQARPEYNHAGNALCFVGQREWSRGLFLDRRAFLASYDPAIDSPDGKIVERILQAAIPVCGGISLEYYFSTVDPEVYGCGSKLPHNIVSLAGVMTGAASDLRPGLSAQMVEIHEPLRILFVVQTTPEIMRRIIDQNPAINSLVEGRWVQLAILDEASGNIQFYEHGAFTDFQPETSVIPRIDSSISWYAGKRENLPFAEIIGDS
jgi:uncharacterized protein YbcC (UPF0753/DUF2309 family)